MKVAGDAHCRKQRVQHTGTQATTHASKGQQMMHESVVMYTAQILTSSFQAAQQFQCGPARLKNPAATARGGMDTPHHDICDAGIALVLDMQGSRTL